jgi:hypothetical protein
MTTGVNLNPDHLQSHHQRLSRIDPSAPSFDLTFRPSNVEPALPIDWSPLGRVDAYRDFNVAVFST